MNSMVRAITRAKLIGITWEYREIIFEVTFICTRTPGNFDLFSKFYFTQTQHGDDNYFQRRLKLPVSLLDKIIASV